MEISDWLLYETATIRRVTRDKYHEESTSEDRTISCMKTVRDFYKSNEFGDVLREARDILIVAPDEDIDATVDYVMLNNKQVPIVEIKEARLQTGLTHKEVYYGRKAN